MTTRRCIGWALIVGSALTAVAIQIRTSELVHTEDSPEVLLREGRRGEGWYSASTYTTHYTFRWLYMGPLLACASVGLLCITLPVRKP